MKRAATKRGQKTLKLNPKSKTLLSSQRQGFNPAEVPSAYGDTLTFWDWRERRVTQTIKLGADGLIPLELRFLHDPDQAHGYVGAALSSNVIHFTKVGRRCPPRLPT